MWQCVCYEIGSVGCFLFSVWTWYSGVWTWRSSPGYVALVISWQCCYFYPVILLAIYTASIVERYGCLMEPSCFIYVAFDLSSFLHDHWSPGNSKHSLMSAVSLVCFRNFKSWEALWRSSWMPHLAWLGWYVQWNDETFADFVGLPYWEFLTLCG